MSVCLHLSNSVISAVDILDLFSIFKISLQVFENRILLLLWKISVLLTSAFLFQWFIYRLMWQWKSGGYLWEWAWVLISLEKRKSLSRKNHNSYKILNLMMHIQLDHSTVQRSKTLRFIPTFVAKLTFWGDRGTGESYNIQA